MHDTVLWELVVRLYLNMGSSWLVFCGSAAAVVLRCHQPGRAPEKKAHAAPQVAWPDR